MATPQSLFIIADEYFWDVITIIRYGIDYVRDYAVEGISPRAIRELQQYCDQMVIGTFPHMAGFKPLIIGCILSEAEIATFKEEWEARYKGPVDQVRKKTLGLLFFKEMIRNYIKVWYLMLGSMGYMVKDQDGHWYWVP